MMDNLAPVALKACASASVTECWTIRIRYEKHQFALFHVKNLLYDSPGGRRHIKLYHLITPAYWKLKIDDSSIRNEPISSETSF